MTHLLDSSDPAASIPSRWQKTAPRSHFETRASAPRATRGERPTRQRSAELSGPLPAISSGRIIDEAFGGQVDAVVGLSLGGVIAQFLAARHPDSVGPVVLVSSAATPTARAVESTRRYGEALGHGRFTDAGAVALEDALPGTWFSPARRLLGVLMGRMLASSGNALPDVLVETAAVMDVDTRPVLSQITAG